jgi:hypothetical protein
MKRPLMNRSTPPCTTHVPTTPLSRRLAWMAALWLASTGVLLLVALLIRWVLKS